MYAAVPPGDLDRSPGPGHAAGACPVALEIPQSQPGFLPGPTAGTRWMGFPASSEPPPHISPGTAYAFPATSQLRPAARGQPKPTNTGSSKIILEVSCAPDPGISLSTHTQQTPSTGRPGGFGPSGKRDFLRCPNLPRLCWGSWSPRWQRAPTATGISTDQLWPHHEVRAETVARSIGRLPIRAHFPLHG